MKMVVSNALWEAFKLRVNDTGEVHLDVTDVQTINAANPVMILTAGIEAGRQLGVGFAKAALAQMVGELRHDLYKTVRAGDVPTFRVELVGQPLIFHSPDETIETETLVHRDVKGLVERTIKKSKVR